MISIGLVKVSGIPQADQKWKNKEPKLGALDYVSV
jgi:hypothetical protein